MLKPLPAELDHQHVSLLVCSSVSRRVEDRSQLGPTPFSVEI